VEELVCQGVEFATGSRLSFSLKMVDHRGRWSMLSFEFDLHLSGRKVEMIQVHLNERGSPEPDRVPRCHLHVRPSDAHIPFPATGPRLIVNLLCEHV